MKLGHFLALSLALQVVSGCAANHNSTNGTELSDSTTTNEHPQRVQKTMVLSSQLAQELVEQLIPSLNDIEQLQVGVTNFVDTSGSYQDASPLSQVFSENLMHALVTEQVPVLDFKTMNYIRVTDHGDFALSRDYLELDEVVQLTHFLVGTMTEQQDGYLVNARLVDVQSNQIISSGQVLIPRAVAENILASGATTTLRKS